jgi:hypothetical protein
VSQTNDNQLNERLDRLSPDKRAPLMLRFATSRPGAPEQATSVHVAGLANPSIDSEVPAEHHDSPVNHAYVPPSKDEDVALADALGPLGICILSGCWILALVVAFPIWWFKKIKGLLMGKSHGEN